MRIAAIPCVDCPRIALTLSRVKSLVPQVSGFPSNREIDARSGSKGETGGGGPWDGEPNYGENGLLGGGGGGWQGDDGAGTLKLSFVKRSNVGRLS